MTKQLVLLWVAVLMLAACSSGAAPGGTGTDTEGTAPVSPTPVGGAAAGSVIEQVVSPTPALDTVQVDTGQAPDLGGKPGKEGACPGLDSALYQVTRSPDPIAVAQRIGMRVREKRVQVTLTLAAMDPAFLSAYDVEVGTQSGDKVQAYVPVEMLCEIAGLEQVVRISPAAVGAAQ